MTEEQIKQLAEAYADSVVPNRKTFDDDDIWHNKRYLAQTTLEWLCKDYLIMEKSKVIEIYTDSDRAKYDKDYMMSQEARAECNLLEAIFGKETFNPPTEI